MKANASTTVHAGSGFSETVSPEKNSKIFSVLNKYQVQFRGDTIRFRQNALFWSNQWLTNFFTAQFPETEMRSLFTSVLVYESTPINVKIHSLTSADFPAEYQINTIEKLNDRQLVSLIDSLGCREKKLNYFTELLLSLSQERRIELITLLIQDYNTALTSAHSRKLISTRLIETSKNNYELTGLLLIRLSELKLLELLNDENGLFINELFPRFLKNADSDYEKRALMSMLVCREEINVFRLIQYMPEDAGRRFCQIFNQMPPETINSTVESLIPSTLVKQGLNDILTFLHAPFSPAIKQRYLFRLANKQTQIDFDAIRFLARHLPLPALNPLFAHLTETLQSNFAEGIYLREAVSNFDQFLAVTEKYLNSPLSPPIKRMLINNTKPEHLIALAGQLPLSSKKLFLSLMSHNQHLKTLTALLPGSPETDADKFTAVLNTLPPGSLKLLYSERSARLPEIERLLCHSRLRAENKQILVRLMPPAGIETFICRESSVITQLEPQVIMQLNRGLCHDRWQNVAHRLKPDQLHLWVDFQCRRQVTFWLQASETKNEIELLLEFNAARSIDLFTHLDIKAIADQLLRRSPEDIIKCINKLCAHSCCLTLLIQMTEIDSERKLNQVITQLEFKQIDQENWHKTRSELLNSLKHLNQIPPSNPPAELSQIASGALPLAEKKYHTKKAARILFRIQEHKYSDCALKSVHDARQKTIRTETEKSASVSKSDPQEKPRAICVLINEKKRQQGLPYKYYYDVRKLSPTIPETSREPSRAEQKRMFGSHKKLVMADHQSLTFKAKVDLKLARMRQADYAINRGLLARLQSSAKERNINLKSVSPGLLGIQPHDGVVVAARGGECLHNLLSENDARMPLRIFETPCRDLMNMHKLKYFIGDIKTDNFVFIEKVTNENGVIHRLAQPQLKFIDMDELCCTQHAHTKDITLCGMIYPTSGTPGYCTLEHIFIRKPGKKMTPVNLKAKDEYAMLMSVLVSVSPRFRSKFEQQRLIVRDKQKEITDAYFQNKELNDALKPFRKGILFQLTKDPEGKKTIANLTEKLIKADYRTQVTRFLTNPLIAPLQPDLHLHEIIKWDAFD